MQPEKIQITDRDIRYAKKSLLGKRGFFDQERKDFIRNLDTVDLQAVPGSGKTTALLAKLLILEKYMPFEDGSGVLVISYTNRAVDEIKENIGKYCPKLFSYPNFIGTIQSFVDQFLAIPYYVNKYKKKPYRIDNEIYEENHYIPHQAHGWMNNRRDKENILYKSRLFEDDTIKYGFDTVKSFPLTTTTSDTYRSLVELKKEIREKGVLCFDDAYIFAYEYLKKNPQIKKIIQKRFRYVFVDEMQDMDKHQHDLLEDLFYRKRVRRHVYQRIGDRNQAIYSEEIKLENIWKKREKTLRLKGSHRLPPNIAQVVKCFGLYFLDIEGLKKDDDGKDIDIKPHIIVFDDHTKSQVIPEFAKIIKRLREEGKIPAELKYPIKAVGWRKEHEESVNLGIKNYHESFEVHEHNPKIDYPNLKSYLLFYEKKEDETLHYIRKNILNAFLRILLLEDIRDENKRKYTTSGLMKFLKEKEDDCIYEDFNLKVYQWCKKIYQGKADDVYNEIKAFIPDFLRYFDVTKEINKSTYFIKNITGKPQGKEGSSISTECFNICNYEDIRIEIQTVHSVKGETHTATLYLETYFHQDGKGQNAKSYESQRLIEQLKGNQLRGNEGERVKQSARIVYVGFSRPTHLLCFAVHKNRFKQENFNNIWEVCNIS